MTEKNATEGTLGVEAENAGKETEGYKVKIQSHGIAVSLVLFCASPALKT